MANKRQPGKGKFKFNQACDAVYRFRGEVTSIFARAKRESLTHDDILRAREMFIYNSPDWARLPEWAQMKVNAYFEAYSESLHAFQLLEWQLTYEGREVTTNEISRIADEKAEEFRETHPSRFFNRGEVWDKVMGCHVWTHSRKPFNPREHVTSQKEKK